jgi:hypothetical protein
VRAKLEPEIRPQTFAFLGISGSKRAAQNCHEVAMPVSVYAANPIYATHQLAKCTAVLQQYTGHLERVTALDIVNPDRPEERRKIAGVFGLFSRFTAISNQLHVLP